jgi:hypothetical protein
MLSHFISKFAMLTIELVVVFDSTAAFPAELPNAEDPEVLLQRIRTRMSEHLAQLPNYTCHQVVDRLIRRANSGSLDRVDTVEFEVAFVGRKELFSKTGGSRFEEESIRNVVPAGTIGNGVFGSHVAALFTGDAAEFKFAGACKKDGHKTFRYDYQVPQERSHFLVRHDSAEGISGYKGSFWVDAETLDLVRLDVKCDRIPSHIGVRMIEESMRYKVVKIRNSEFLLPRNSQLAASDQLGNYSLNMVSLEGCREFSGDSVVTYDAPVGNGASSSSADRQVPEP